jgi:Response receiver domain
MNDVGMTLSDLVRDVYIKPIRSLLAIDDEFPTLDELLDPDILTAGLAKKGTDRLREIIKFARGREVPWLVDVHDGKGITRDQEKKIAPRLHSSDLMVLDYKLNGEDLGGDTAIKIIRGLATNDHFNLVLLYTKGNAGSVVDILHEIALGLVSTSDPYRLSDDDRKKVTDALETWNFKQPNIADQLVEEFTSQLFLKTFERPGQPLKWILDENGSATLKELLTEGAKLTKAATDLFLRWLFSERRQKLLPQLFDKDLGQIRVNADEDCCWISCEKVFITLLSKQCLPREFETKIVEAIVASHPAAHRLLLTKMRSCIEQRGLVAEVDILRDVHVQSAWLGDFLHPTPKDKTSAIVGTVTRHWEAIGDVLHEELTSFGSTLHAVYQRMLVDATNRSGSHVNKANSDETLARYNNYVSTKPFDRGHLTTGHVFSFPERKKTNLQEASAVDASGVVTTATQKSNDLEYWMCLSPACDMVPGQKKKAVLDDGDNKFLSFTAVRLHSVETSKAIKNATGNLCIFLKLENDIQPFSILKDLLHSPDWEQMIAVNFGIFDAQTKMLKMSSITTVNGKVEACEMESTVIAQLRTEYAANLLQKFGDQLTRPGLGIQFKGRS